jgi:hypothetical protein
MQHLSKVDECDVEVRESADVGQFVKDECFDGRVRVDCVACYHLAGSDADGQGIFLEIVQINHMYNLPIFNLSVLPIQVQPFPLAVKPHFFNRNAFLLTDEQGNPTQIDHILIADRVGLLVIPPEIDNRFFALHYELYSQRGKIIITLSANHHMVIVNYEQFLREKIAEEVAICEDKVMRQALASGEFEGLVIRLYEYC